jgi:PAS domain S-box-containing protein
MLPDYFLRQRDYLLEISRAMTSKLDLPSLLQLILESAAEMLGAQVALIAVREPDGTFRVPASYGVPAGALGLFRPLLENIPIVLSGGQWSSWQIPDLHMRLRLVSQAAGLPLRQVVALPLTLDEDLIGVIYVFRTGSGAFSSNDRQVLASFADQAAIAMRNARLYQEVLAEKSRLDAIIEHSADGVMILDRACRIQVFNRALSRMTGWRAGEAVGQPCAAVLRLQSAQGVNLCGERCPMVEEFAKPANGEAPASYYVEGDIARPDGSRVSAGVTHTLLYDDAGRLLNIVVNVHDITRFREAEELKSTFISIISHELKTPVALIKGYAGTLRREDANWDQATVREGLAIIEQESDRLDRLINNLLDASRIEAGGLKLELADLSLPRLAERVVEKFRTQTQIHQFQLDFPADFPLVYADEERISEVFYNLLSNAIKYSPRGGTIRIGGQAQDGTVTVYVSDEGIGIPADEQTRLFQRFYRVDSGLRRRTQGAGLGLYLCRAIIEAHGGRIWVESQPGQGATFKFTLPRSAGE